MECNALQHFSYLSPWDRNSELYGTEAYNEYFCRQLEELLTEYGDVFYVWFDNACGEGPNGKKQKYDFPAYFELIRKYQPNAVIFNDFGPDIRWCGNEAGAARHSEWAVVPSELCQTYAVPLIMGEIKRFLRDDGAIKVSRSLKENGWKAKKKEQELSLKLGRNPTMEELCESLAMKREEVVMAMDAVSEVDSLYKTLYQKEGSEILLVDKIQSKKDESEEVLNRITLEKLLQELAGRERALIQKRYFEEKTQVQVAKELEMSQVQVSRLEKKILASMRKKIIFHSV